MSKTERQENERKGTASQEKQNSNEYSQKKKGRIKIDFKKITKFYICVRIKIVKMNKNIN